jgi:hypothetical protein
MTIPLKGKHGNGKTLIIDNEDYHHYLNHPWSVHRKGYLISNTRKPKDGLRFHRLIVKVKPGQLVDHKNGNRLDNRKRNLRICNNSQNLANRGPQKNNTSGYKGVTWSKQRKKWIAQIAVNKKRINIGASTNIYEAIEMYNNKAVELFGEFAWTNSL